MMKTRIASILVVLLTLASAAPLAAQSWRTESKSRQNRGQDFLDVRIKYGVGRFDLERGSDRLLYQINTKYDEDIFEMRNEYFESDGRGSLRIEIEGIDDDYDFGDDYEYKGGSLSVGLPSNTPMSVSVKLGAAEAKLDLGGLLLERLIYETGASDTHIRFSEPNPGVAEYCSFKAAAASFRVDDLGNSGCRRITLSGGVGELELDFPGEWSHDATADINVGLGGIEPRVPVGLGVRIEKSTFLMSFDAPGFEEQEGGVWISNNWENARHHLTITISGALGGITVARL
jgi:hypothetical protein